MSPMTRRDALEALLAAPVLAGLTWTVAEARTAARQAAAGDAGQDSPFTPQFLTDHEFATVRLLADLVIPADDRSGSASDARVPEFIDFMMVDQPERQVALRGGLAWLDAEHLRRFDRRFLDCDDAQRRDVLDAIAWPDRAEPSLSHGAEFFARFRDLTATGFWTSRIGIVDLEYQGNVPLTEWDGCPEEALRHLGLSEPDP